MPAKDEILTNFSTSADPSAIPHLSSKPPSALSEQPPSPSLPDITQINTPQRERGRPLYPTTLAKSTQGQGGRIPLHRRGTSRTYERLEDLLREAGYKETRVFTPETERHRTGNGNDDDYDEEGRRKQERKGSNVSAVVNFLSGLISTLPGTGIGSASSSSSAATSVGNSMRSQSQSTGETSISENKALQAQDPIGVIRIDDDLWIPPSPSPSSRLNPRLNLGQKQQQSNKYYGSQSHVGTVKARPSTGTPQKSSLALDALRRHSAAMVFTSPLNSNSELANTTSSRSHPNLNYSSANVKGGRLHIITSRITESPTQIQPHLHAHAPLRHMSSAPSIPRSNTTPPIKQHKQIRRLTNADASTNAPPLPSNWLLNVARAVMSANGEGASTGPYIGGPRRMITGSTTSLSSSIGSQGKLSRANSERGRGRGRGVDRVRADRTSHRPRGRLLNEEETKRLRPITPLFDTKSTNNGGNVVMSRTTKVNVVCRSAPTSRATSRVRGGNDSRNSSKKRGKSRQDQNKRECDNLPSLGVTTIEGGANASLLASLLLALPHSSNGRARGAEDETSEDDEDEDEGDIDLARLLVPSKRQRSIASLRRCLWRDPDGGGAGSRLPSRPQSRLGPVNNNGYRPEFRKNGMWTSSLRSNVSTSASRSQSSLEVEGSKQGSFSVPPSPAVKGGRVLEIDNGGDPHPPGLMYRTSVNTGPSTTNKVHSSTNPSSRRHSRQPSSSFSVAPSVSASAANVNTSPDPDDSFAQALERDFRRQRRGSIDMDEDEWKDLERLGLPGFGKGTQNELKKRGAIPGWLWS